MTPAGAACPSKKSSNCAAAYRQYAASERAARSTRPAGRGREEVGAHLPDEHVQAAHHRAARAPRVGEQPGL
eukprot:scaffold654_cov273-Prasinococcus_capsulatus_cf.AAC.5